MSIVRCHLFLLSYENFQREDTGRHMWFSVISITEEAVLQRSSVQEPDVRPVRMWIF